MDKKLVLVAGYRFDGDISIEFTTSREVISLKEHTTLISEIVAFSDGLTSTESVLNALAKKYPEYERSFIEDVVDDLESLGVLIESRRIAEWFHGVSSNPMPYYHSLSPPEIEAHRLSPRKTVEGISRITLPITDTDFTEMLRKRFSCRTFDGTPVSLDAYGYLLRNAYGQDLYPVPSGGALYPLSLYLVVNIGSEELPAGFYQYDSAKNELVGSPREYDEQTAAYAFDSDFLTEDAAGIFVIAADIQRQGKKYSNRGYRYSLIEVGHVAQNILVSAVDAEVHTLEYGGFLDEEVSVLFDLDARGEAPAIAIAVGNLAGVARGEKASETRAYLDERLVGRGKPLNWVTLIRKEKESRPPFHMALSHYKPGVHQDAKKTYASRLSLGTDVSSDLAMVKSIAEAYERHVCGQVRVDLYGKAEQIPHKWVNPNEYVPFTEEQIERLGFLRFSPGENWEWVLGRTFNGQEIAVPVDMVFYPFFAERAFGRRNCYSAHSSGVAAHTSFEEAKRRSLLELVERDAIIRNWLSKSVPNMVHLSLLPNHWRERARHWSNQGWEIRIVDFSHFGLAVVCVFAISIGGERPYVAHGSSASDRSFDEAISKAFHEMEVTMAVNRGRRRNRVAIQDVDSPEDHGALYHYPDYKYELEYLFSGVYVEGIPDVGCDDLFGQFKSVFVSLTEEEAPLHVVRALSSELVPINFGYGRDHISHKRALVVDDVPVPHYLA